MSQGFSGATAFGNLVAGPGFDADEAVVGAAFGLATALAVGAFGLSELAGFAAVLAFAFAGAVVLGAFATCPSLGCSYCLCLPAALPPNARDVLAAAGIQEIQPANYVLRLSAAVQVCPCGKTGRKSSAPTTSRRSQFLTNAGLKINKKMQSLTIP
ncbi:hypothetical protein [Mesorhizobium temperatum]|uniref:hypothetical protein n=1 Tax=Mesorhizobium temperatum TaxID=241416 RepID=UPI001FD8F4FC|nr:hypothetical protein [Mesorhizobium temperatum]